jgi:hypothetical protein
LYALALVVVGEVVDVGHLHLRDMGAVLVVVVHMPIE